MRVIIIGHRGARGLAPENTLASFRAAIKYHVDMVEMDLRLTKDGIIVTHHDPDIKDAAGNSLLINEHLYEDLKKHKPDLSTFRQAVETVAHSAPIYAEVKPGEPIPPIIKELKSVLANGWRGGEFVLASFSQPALRQLHQALPGIKLIVIEKWSGIRASRRARELDTKTVCMNQKWLWWGFIRSVKRSGWTLYAYTLNNPKKALRWQKYGLAGIVTDYPDRFEK